MKSLLLKCRQVITISSLTLLVACGGSDNDSSNAIYEVEFAGTWGAVTHPTNIPPGEFPNPTSAPHFSPIVVATHNAKASLWESGKRASAGTEEISETGNPTTFLAEADDAIAAGTVHSVVRGEGGFISPGTQKVAIQVNSDFPKVTFLTMIAPSPDWFAGARVESLLSDGKLVDTMTVDVLAYDAGTDNGERYITADDNNVPRGTIQGLITDPADTSFSSEAARKIGTLTFTKQ